MAIQVLGLRDRLDIPGKKREMFFTRNWRFEKIQDVFDPDIRAKVISQIPDNEKHNLYFTEADCFEERGRKLREQWAIPFDIDDLVLESTETMHPTALKAANEALDVLGLPPNSCPIVFSGNGVQFHILLDAPILSDEFFDALRPHYSEACKKIQARLLSKDIHGRVDTSVFSAARLMRLPDTDNRKPGKPTRRATVLCASVQTHDFDLTEKSGLKYIDKEEVVPDIALKNYPRPDTPAVCGGCKFLQFCKDSPDKVAEPWWYAMLSITARLENGREVSHAYSEGHPGYSHYETELKIDQALEASGPRTCKNIDSHWGQCSTCENFEKVVSPIMIRGPDYIKSADCGYREQRLTKEGALVAGKPAYQDLIKTYTLERPYKVFSDSEQICAFNGTHWEIVPDSLLKEWVTKIVRPEPNVAEMKEFIGQLKARSIIDREWFIDTTHQKLNFKNCVLDTSTGETFAHKPEFGFFNILPFAYDKDALCPTWDKFLLEICNGDKGKAQVLEEFAGYAMSGDVCWLEKALLMVGDGANGKSTFMETLGNVVGPMNRSSVPFEDLEKDTKRYLLVNKLFNYSEETGQKALFESKNFKNLVGGGMMTIKNLYIQEYEVKNRAKFLMAANEMPMSADKSYGFLRRLLIVKFNQRFVLGSPGHDPGLKEKLNNELAGICNSLIRAYNRLKKRGRLTDLYDNDKYISVYIMETNSVAQFFSDVIQLDESRECGTGELYEEYVTYCQTNGDKAYSHNKFSRLLAREVPDLDNRRFIRREGSRVFRGYKGISFYKEY